MATFKSPAVNSGTRLYPDAYVNDKGLVRDAEYRGLEEVIVSFRGTVLTADGDPAAVAPTINKEDAITVEDGENVSVQFTLRSGDAPVTWDASGLPAGLTMSAGGLLSGAPSEAGTFSVVVTATNTAGSDTSAIQITVTPIDVEIDTEGFNEARVAEPFEQIVSASGTGPYVWGVVDGTLPEGISLVASTGVISGTPITEGEFSFTIGVQGYSSTDTKTFTVNVLEEYQPPVVETQPTISGTAVVGGTLTATTGDWVSELPITYEYAWFDGELQISGESGTTYTIPNNEESIGKVYRVRVTASNSKGSESSYSTPTPATIGIAPSVTASISGDPEVGQELTLTSSANGIPTPTVTRQWLRDGNDIVGETGTSYTLTVSDISASISVKVTATNSQGEESATTNSIGPVAGISPSNTTAPVISGDGTVGETLSLSTGTWFGIPEPTISSQWLLDGNDIPGETGSTLTIDESHIGGEISVRVTATNSEGQANEVSNVIGPIVIPEEPDDPDDPEDEGEPGDP